MTFVRLRPTLVAVAAMAVVATLGCSADTGIAPNASALGNANSATSSLDGVFTAQLRGFPNDPLLPPNPVFGYGHLQLRVNSPDNSCLPPNPISPQPGTSVIAVCGKIFNEGGALYQGGGIYTGNLFGDGAILVAAFNGELPPNPCRRYDVAGAVTVSDAVAADMIANPTLYRVQLDGDVLGQTTRLGGLIDGSAWGPVGTRPETDPYFAEKVCAITVAP